MAQHRVIYSAEASNDIRLIRQYSVEQWGKQQANIYVRSLKESLESLGEHPDIGRVVSPDEPTHRRLVVGRHVVHYRVGESRIEVSRVLHERMDASAQLD